MDGWLPAAGTAYLRSGAEMAARFARYPGVPGAHRRAGPRRAPSTSRWSRPELPDFPVPAGHTEATWLRELVARKARRAATGRRTPSECRARTRRSTTSSTSSSSSSFPGYFLIVLRDRASSAAANDILCQGRGSAANSAVCYALGITNVDPVAHQPAVRAVPVPGAGRPAGHRPGHRDRPPRGGDPARLRHATAATTPPRSPT